MKRIWVIIFLFPAFQATAQKCSRYDKAMEKGKSFFSVKAPLYDSALKYFLKAQIAAKECGISTDEPTNKIRELFTQVQGERDKATLAQEQTQKAKVASLVNAAYSLKKTDPTIGRSLAAAAFSILRSHLTASVLHEYLSDTSLNVYTRLKTQFRSPFALDDNQHMIYAAGASFVEYDLKSDITKNIYQQSDSGLLYVDDVSADANILVGQTYPKNGTGNRTLHLFFRQTGRTKPLAVLDRSAYAIKLSLNRNAIGVLFHDSSFAVYDTNGKKMAERRKVEGKIIANFNISKNGRYVAFTTEWAASYVRYIDCGEQHQQEDSVLFGRGFNAMAFSNSAESDLWFAHGEGICTMHLETKFVTERCYTIGPAIKYLTPFNHSGNWACATVDNTIILLDPGGKAFDQLLLDPSKKILDMRVSSEDSSLLISLQEDKPVVWEFKRSSNLVRTIEVPEQYPIYPKLVIERNKILGILSNYSNNRNSQYIVLCNEDFEVIKTLDSLDALADIIEYINYLPAGEKLIIAGNKNIKIKVLGSPSEITYQIPAVTYKYSRYSVNDDFTSLTSIDDEAATIYSTNLKKKPSTVYFKNFDMYKVYGWKGKFLVHMKYQLEVFSAAGKKEKLFAPTEEYPSFYHLGSSSGSNHIFAVRYGNMESNILEIYTKDGFKLQTFRNIPKSYSISIDEKNGFFYVVTSKQIFEYRLPTRTIADLPTISIANKLRYQIPGALEDLLKSKDIIQLAEGAMFSLQNYHKLLDDNDLAHFKSLVAKMPEAANRPGTNSFDVWIALKRLQEEFISDPLNYIKEGAIIQKLILKFNN